MKNKARWSNLTVCILALLSIMLTQGSRMMGISLILAGTCIVVLGFTETRKNSLGRNVLISGLSLAGVATGLIAAFLCRS